MREDNYQFQSTAEANFLREMDRHKFTVYVVPESVTD